MLETARPWGTPLIDSMSEGIETLTVGELIADNINDFMEGFRIFLPSRDISSACFIDG